MIKICGMTEAGAVRKLNQDNFFVDGVYKEKIEEQSAYYATERNPEDTFVCAVFDGMGGLAAGEEAALKAVEYLSNYMSKVAKGRLVYEEETLIAYINEKLCEWKKAKGVSMGSTIALLRYSQGKVKACNLGDSRIYRYREKRLEQISVDHNEAATFKKFGNNFGEGSSNVLTQFLGVEEEEFIVEPAISPEYELESGDIYLLCSDGLSGMVSDEQILRIMRKKECSVSDMCQQLYKIAMENGGKDNITILVIQAQ